MSISEYQKIISSKSWSTGEGTMEGKWFAEHYDDALKWGNTMGHGGDSFRVVQIDTADSIANGMHSDHHLDGIGAAKYAQLEDLNNPKTRIIWSKEVKSSRC